MWFYCWVLGESQPEFRGGRTQPGSVFTVLFIIWERVEPQISKWSPNLSCRFWHSSWSNVGGTKGAGVGSWSDVPLCTDGEELGWNPRWVSVACCSNHLSLGTRQIMKQMQDQKLGCFDTILLKFLVYFLSFMFGKAIMEACYSWAKNVKVWFLKS